MLQLGVGGVVLWLGSLLRDFGGQSLEEVIEILCELLFWILLVIFLSGAEEFIAH